MDEKVLNNIGAALGRIPQGLFILTARHEDRRAGIIASWVQQASFEPPMVSVSVAKGRAVMPLISESRQFALCQLPKGDKTFIRKFAGGTNAGEDPFLSFEMIHGAMIGLPIPTGCLSYFECEVTCHVDVEGDHDIFVGAIKNAAVFPGEPALHIRENGLRY